MYFVKKQSYSKCCWRIQLVLFILKLFNLFKCFLAYLISKIMYVTDAFIVPNSYNGVAKTRIRVAPRVRVGVRVRVRVRIVVGIPI